MNYYAFQHIFVVSVKDVLPIVCIFKLYF